MLYLVTVRGPCVVHEDIESAEFGKSEVCDCLPLRFIGDVLTLEDQVARVQGCDLLSTFRIDISQDDLSTLLAESASNCSSESGSATYSKSKNA